MKVDIIFGILLTILNKKNVTASYLASKYDISIRTVYRYVSILETNNIPITTKSGRGGGISISYLVNLQSTYFTPIERLTLLELTQNLANKEIKISIQTKLLALR